MNLGSRELVAALVVLGLIGAGSMYTDVFSGLDFFDEGACGVEVVETPSGQTFDSLQDIKQELGDEKYQKMINQVESDGSTEIIDNNGEKVKVKNCIE